MLLGAAALTIAVAGPAESQVHHSGSGAEEPSSSSGAHGRSGGEHPISSAEEDDGPVTKRPSAVRRALFDADDTDDSDSALSPSTPSERRTLFDTAVGKSTGMLVRTASNNQRTSSCCFKQWRNGGPPLWVPVNDSKGKQEKVEDAVACGLAGCCAKNHCRVRSRIDGGESWPHGTTENHHPACPNYVKTLPPTWSDLHPCAVPPSGGGVIKLQHLVTIGRKGQRVEASTVRQAGGDVEGRC